MNDQPPTDVRHRPAGRRRRRIAAAAALAATAIALLTPRPAEAGSYTVRQCTASVPEAQATWERTTDRYGGRSRCGSGAGLQANHEGGATTHGRYGAWTWRAPEGAIFTAVRASASLTRRSGHRGELSVTGPDGRAQHLGRAHEAFRAYERRGRFSSLEARLRCARPSGCGRGDERPAHAHVKGVLLRVTDGVAPSVDSLAGTLFADRVARGSRTLSFAAADRGGGIRRVSVEANDVPLAGVVRDCRLSGSSATRVVPCPAATVEERAVDTTHPAFTTGPNVVAACAEDLAIAGRPNRACARRRVWVDNACPASAPAGTRLEAGFAAAGARTTVRSDHRAMLTGRLLDDVGQPVAGATVCALSRVALPGEPITIAATAMTGADGRYSIELSAGASRRVFVHHVHGTAVMARHGLAIRSRVRPGFRVRGPRAARRGDRLRFGGRLPGPACAGRLVEVQARLAKRRWQVFRTARTDQRCRFAARYRLRATTGPTRYRFRARVRRQPGYPYAPGTSVVRAKRVLGPRQ